MLLRADKLRKAAAEEAAAAAAAAGGGGLSSKPNILQVWRQGGYSDDLLLAAFCTEHGLPIGMPASAYFPQQLPATYTAKQYWNYLRRQLYYMVRQVLRLFRVLSPAASDEVLRPQLNLGLLWLGWVLENALLPFCIAYCFFCDHIVWGGIRYHKAGGRVRRVVHPGQQ
ncbi:hypothetical protein OEZ86_010543 [Tetradesmus obliquus]|nr:hypothetical protein OEZ86_010543 [Tetradesmus obliquus]